jgi:hypothetical protein
MKQFQILIVLVVFSFSVISQEVSIFPSNDKQLYTELLKTEDSTYVHCYEEGQSHDYIWIDDKYVISPGNTIDRGLSVYQPEQIETLDSIEPGVLPEADLPYKMEYTSDGQRLIVMFHHTNNVLIYDVDTHEILGSVDVGVQPEDMFVSEQYIYVCCYISNDVYIINRDDYTIEHSFEVDEQPCVIKVNNDESILYVGFHGNDHKGGALAAYDLNTYDQIFISNSVFIDQINMWEGHIGRLIYNYSKFILINDDQNIACLKQTVTRKYLIIIDALTGDIVKEYTMRPFAMIASSGGDTLYTVRVTSYNASLTFYRIDVNTYEIIDSIDMSNGAKPISWQWQENIALNENGTKVFIEMSNMIGDPYGCVVDFESYGFQTHFLEGARPCYFLTSSYDNRYVISPVMFFRIFDFETQDYVCYKYIGYGKTCKVVEASPVSYRFAWSNHSASVQSSKKMRQEMIDFYDFTDPSNPYLADSILCGVEPEADFTYDAILNSKHMKIVAGNPLSENISIIDANTHELDTLIDLKRISIVENITDDLMVLTGYDCKFLYVFDLNTLSIIMQFPNAGSYCEAVIPSPDQKYFYTYNLYDNQLIKYQIDGLNIEKIDSLYIEEHLIHYIDWDLRYFPEISPDGNYIVFHYFGDIRIVHTGSMELECSVPVGANVFDVAFSDDSKRICFAHGWSKDFWSIIYLDGLNSYLEHSVYAGGSGGVSVEFNHVDQKFYCARSTDIYIVDPVIGVVDDTIQLEAKNRIMQIGIDPDGLPVVQTYNYLYYNDQEYFLIEPARRFNIDKDKQYCIIPSPGPDRVYVLDFLTTDLYEVPVSPQRNAINIFPNPSDNNVTIKSSSNIQEVKLYNADGKLIKTISASGKQVKINTSALKYGVYIFEVKTRKNIVRNKVVVSH